MSQCYKCQIKTLQVRNQQLQTKLDFYETRQSENMCLTYSQKSDIWDKFDFYTSPQKWEYGDKLSHSHFITITFDPAKFGPRPDVQLRKDYIMNTLLELHNLQLFTDCYGCFEFHQNGIVHSHLIMITGMPKVVYRMLKEKFTDNKHNKIAIQVDLAKHPQAKKYIDKESSHFYVLKTLKEEPDDEPDNEPMSNPLDDGI